jgi:hypothetical protein
MRDAVDNVQQLLVAAIYAWRDKNPDACFSCERTHDSLICTKHENGSSIQCVLSQQACGDAEAAYADLKKHFGI